LVFRRGLAFFLGPCDRRDDQHEHGRDPHPSGQV
jgi:hypothetical protein